MSIIITWLFITKLYAITSSLTESNNNLPNNFGNSQPKDVAKADATTNLLINGKVNNDNDLIRNSIKLN